LSISISNSLEFVPATTRPRLSNSSSPNCPFAHSPSLYKKTKGLIIVSKKDWARCDLNAGLREPKFEFRFLSIPDLIISE